MNVFVFVFLSEMRFSLSLVRSTIFSPRTRSSRSNLVEKHGRPQSRTRKGHTVYKGKPSPAAVLTTPLLVVSQLEAIKCKPQRDEITDKLLIDLHSSFGAVCTNLALRIPEPSVKEITATLKEFEAMKP